MDAEWLGRMERLRMVYEGYRAAAELNSSPESAVARARSIDWNPSQPQTYIRFDGNG